jgi:hypothetical protein
MIKPPIPLARGEPKTERFDRYSSVMGGVAYGVLLVIFALVVWGLVGNVEAIAGAWKAVITRCLDSDNCSEAATISMKTSRLESGLGRSNHPVCSCSRS